MKKIFSLAFLAVFLVSSVLAGCGGSGGGQATEDQSPLDLEYEDFVTSDFDDDISAVDGDWQTKDYSGTVLKYVDSEHWMFITSQVNWGYAFYRGMLEWMELTGATIEMLPALEIAAVLSGITAGEGYDMIPNGAYWSMNDMVMDINDEIGYFAAKYGTNLTETIGLNKYNGNYISVSWPWTFGKSAMHYNAELLDRLGVERPTQMFMRGAWTWDAYWELVKHVSSLDMDGDGEPDYVSVANQPHFTYMMRIYEENEDGTYSNVADTQQLRDFADMIYNGYNILDIYQEEMPQPWNGYSYSSERYPWIQSVGIPYYDPTCFFGFTDNVGEIMEWVPMPAYGEGNERGGGCESVYILKGAQNRDAALHFNDFIINAVGDSAMQMVTQGRRNYGYVGMTGSTPESAEYLEWWENFIESEYRRFESSPYFDWDVYDACVDYWERLPNYQGSPHGWRRSYFYPPTFHVFKDYPPATAVSMFLEELQTMLDEHNDFIASR